MVFVHGCLSSMNKEQKSLKKKKTTHKKHKTKHYKKLLKLLSPNRFLR